MAKTGIIAIILILLGLAPVPAPADLPATVLLITSDKLADSWKPFVEWKTRTGRAVKTVTVESIEKQYKGRDIQEKIRACCLDHIKRCATGWVILGGDSGPDNGGQVPDRDTVHRVFGKKYDDIPTDIYYVSEGDWDADDDGVYGDFKKDRDSIAYTNKKACIGRIPVRTAQDVASYTEKVIAYESKYPATKFATSMVYTCPEAGAYPKLGTSRKVLAGIWKKAELMHFFASRTPWDGDRPGDHDLNPENWVKLINKKTAGKMHIHGHGFLPVWILEKRTKVSEKHVRQLTNRDAYLAITTVSCFTGQFDGKKDPAITECMLRCPKAGAVLAIAPAREGVPAFHDPRKDFRLMVTEGKMDGTTATMTNYWKHALGEGLTAGEAFRAAKADLAEDAKKTAAYHFVQCELNLLGDPTLDLRAACPSTPKLEVPAVIKVGKQKLKVGTSAPGSTICLWKGDEVYEVVKADAGGAAQAEVECKSPGKLLVTVSGPSLNVASGKIDVK
jgi:hypothetical protein